MVLSRPWRQCMLLGQVTLEAVLASYLALYFANSSPRVSGLGLALTSFKPSYGVPLALLMVVRRDWPALRYGALFGFLLNLPAAAILAYRAGGIHALSEQLANTSAGFQTMQPTNSPVLSPFRIDTVALIGRFVGHAPDIAAQLLVAITILGLAAVVIRAASRSAAGPQSFGWSSGVVLAAVLLSVYHQPHDLLLLTVGFVALAAQSFYPGVPNPRMRMTMLVLCTFLAFNYTVSDFVLQRLQVLAPGGTGELQGLVRSPYAVAFASLNGLALLALFCAYLVATLDQPRVVPQATSVAA
jgi:Glycosyltransferase family 87